MMLSSARPPGGRPPAVRPRTQGGFTLVELMVGVLLGLLTTVVIAQVMSFAEGQKRNTTSGSDAQLSGALALYTLQRDIQMAGFGLTVNPAAMGCSVKYSASADFTLAPVMIEDGVDGAPDTVTVIMSSSATVALPMRLTGNHPQDGTYFAVEAGLGVQAGDYVVAIPEAHTATNHCAILQVTDNPSGTTEEKLSATNIPHALPESGVVPASGFAAGGFLVNVGALVHRTYSVSPDGALQLGTLSPADGSTTTENLYPQVVNLQAYYGKDTDGNGQVDTYDAIAPTTAAEWQTVLTLRLAIVARNAEYQNEVVTTQQPQWDVGADVDVDGSATCHTDRKCVTLIVGPDDSDDSWQHYRYKVFDTVIPLRNVLWHS